ncbi:MAG TPA: acetate--CoA ligase family protein [Candidatus Nanoarchaeia archaeon]|nr:acetate--CoA ligase family protein [Candidatus Nanoarchaeia archaeon]
MNGKNDVWELLKECQIPVLPIVKASSMEEVIEVSNSLGYPVVMKISSPDISHKSDVGGIILDINSEEEVKNAYRDMMDTVKLKVPDARIDGVMLQKMAEPGIEVIIGVKLDPQFGHVIMFGLGGIFVEIYRDVSFRVTPVNSEMARDMILEIKGSPILMGARGRSSADINAIINVIVKLSEMLEKNPDIVELDINPLIVYEKNAVAVDARMLKNDKKLT